MSTDHGRCDQPGNGCPRTDHTRECAAVKLGLTVDFLHRRPDLPHQHYGKRTIRYTDTQIAAIRARFAHDDTAPAAADLRPTTRRRRAS